MRAPVASVVGAAGGASARGASHIARDKPNQDAVAWDQRILWTYLAVSDGHGSAAHYRSERGARFAVETAIALLREITNEGSARAPAALSERVASLPAMLTARWRERVETDIAAEPVREPAGPAAHAVYGATCVAAAVGPGMALFMQIGDGDMFAATSSGTVERPLPSDDLIGEQTYSLCLPDAAEHVHVGLFCAPSPLCAPDFVLAATDGFAKSFDDEAAVVDVVRQYRDAVAKRGLPTVMADLEPWLAKCSQMGSGDDTTLAMFSAEAPGADSIPAPASRGSRPAGPTERPPNKKTLLAPILAAALLGAAAGAFGATWAWPRLTALWPVLAGSSPVAAPVAPELPRMPAMPGKQKAATPPAPAELPPLPHKDAPPAGK